MKKIKWGVIADDFTGASDAASFLVKSGNKTALITKIPESFCDDYDCIVLGLKIRSIDKLEAIKEVEKALDFFEKNGVTNVYYKYCSTFDSTPKGNIGPVMDYLLTKIGTKYSILCPSLPVNGRTVKNGVLYVNGVKLSESPLKDHPLNPMWDSFIPELMKDQSHYNCYVVSRDDLETGEYLKNIEAIDDDYFYLVPDYATDNDGKMIAKCFKNLPLLSGGSGLLEYLSLNNKEDKSSSDFDINKQKAVILCGSCSAMTHKQIEAFKKTDNITIDIDAKDLLNGKITADIIFKKIINNLPKVTLVYSNGCNGNLNRNDDDFHMCSIAMERFLADLADLAKKANFNKIIVAGGETSGAVTLKLGYNSFNVGESVAPGVPLLTPFSDLDMRILLKSGNFGDENFFVKSLEAK